MRLARLRGQIRCGGMAGSTLMFSPLLFCCVALIDACSSRGCFLTKREVKNLSPGLEEFDLECPVFYLSLLPDKLIQARFSNFSAAVSSAISPTVVAGRGAIQFHLKANGYAVLRRS